MSSGANTPMYDTRPARELVIRLRHQLQQDKEKMIQAGMPLLQALLTLGADQGPLTISLDPSAHRENRVCVRVPYRGKQVFISFDHDDCTFGVFRDGPPLPVPLVYDPVTGVYVPDPERVKSGELAESTALEVLLNAAWSCLQSASR